MDAQRYALGGKQVWRLLGRLVLAQHFLAHSLEQF